jgi:predicted metal-dependent hydrolase
MEAMQLGGTAIDVVRRDIKHVHLSVHPPEGRVRLAAPHRTSIDSLRLFAIEKLGWIRTQQQRMQGQDREPPRAFVDRESHYVWGRRCLLRVTEVAARPSVEARPRSLLLQVRPGASHERRAAVLEEWYRDQVRTAAAPRLDHWVQVLGVRRPEIRVQRMRTKWGTCNRSSYRVLLNTWLAKKPPECLDYILLHELAHLKVPDHGPRFVAIMDRLMPSWRQVRDRLSRLPTGPETWEAGATIRAVATDIRVPERVPPAGPREAPGGAE